MTASLVAAPHARAGPPSEADQDGDKVYDDLEADMAVHSPDDTLAVIVLFNSGKSAAQTAAAEADVGDFDAGYQYKTIPAVAAEMTVEQIEDLSHEPEVVQIQPDAPMSVDLDTARASFGVDAARPEFAVDGNNEAGTCPLATSYCPDDVVVAVIDTGIRATHVDLDGGKVLGFANCLNTTSCSEVTAFDDNGHGTHVSSIIAGTGEGSSTRALSGVAPGAALVGVKVLGSSGSGSTSGVDAGVEWAITNEARFGIEALNMSLGSSGSYDGTDTTSRVVNRAAAAGITPFVSAGNSGPKASTIGSPGVAKFAVTVGAMADPKDIEGTRVPGFGLPSFSSRGPTADGRLKPDLVAPGVDIMAASSSSTTGYVTLSGTSMSSPFAAGVGALVLDANPSLGSTGTACAASDISGDCADGVIDSSMSTSLRDLLTVTTVDWGPAGPDNDYGFGRLDAYAAVDAASALAGTGGPDLPTHTFIADSLSTVGTDDLYTIAVTSTDFPIAVTFVMPNWTGSSTPDFDIYLLDPSGVQKAFSNGTSRQETIGFQPAVTGNWTLKVHDYAGSGDYWFDASFAGAPVAPPTPPNDPSGLTAAAASSSQIDLAWSDNSSDEDGFKVERSPGGAGTWAQIATVGAGVATYSNGGLTSSTTYDYRVRAYKNSGGDSGYTNVASATTLDAPPPPPETLLYLHNNPTPPVGDTTAQKNLLMTASSPTATTLYRYSTNYYNNQPGRYVDKRNSTHTESNPKRMANWVYQIPQAATYSGNVALNVWVAVKDFRCDKTLTFKAFLREKTSATTDTGTQIATTTGTSPPQTTGICPYRLATLNIPVDRTMAAGLWLELKLTVSDATGAAGLFAYDTTSYASTLTLP